MQFFLQLLPPAEILESLLAVVICALILLRTSLVFLVQRTQPIWLPHRIALELFFWLVAVFLVGYLVADLNRVLKDDLDHSAITAFTIICVIGVVVFSGIGFCARFGAQFLKPKILLAVRVAYLGILIGVCCWFVSRTYAPTTLEFSETPADSMNLMSEASGYLAITDNGAQIALFEIDLRERSNEARQYLATSTATPSGAKVIPRADASISANCHGWVFTGGKYLLKGKSVDLILSDNGYAMQGAPEPGDVIVYRNEAGECLHTGIVSGILLDGTCIIESKWGIAGRFLHQAEDQPYGLNYSFYRSARSGHLVTIIHRDDLDSFLTNMRSADSSRSPINEDEPLDGIQKESELQPTLTE